MSSIEKAYKKPYAVSVGLPIINETLAGKKVLIRGDVDVPLSPFDDTRLRAIKPTIDYLLGLNCEVILCGHLGRPNGVDPSLSTKPIQEYFPKIKVLENLRFDPREETNEESLAKELAALAEVYVNEAFAACERNHASIVGVPKYLPHFAGFRLAKEIEVLNNLLNNSARPMLAIIGGAKLETKLPVISQMAQVADAVIVGGKLLQEFSGDVPRILSLSLTPDTKDVTLDSISKIESHISNAKTIVWNGPMGFIENYTYQVGTRRIAELVAASSAYKVVGGGDTIAFVSKLGLLDKFDWVSTGGGSMLKFLAGEKLPGIEALTQ